ncbi:hypothetical protein [Streptomyces graminilatus]|uniref:hypothetical protein n=1 Tax=Streptomyces graminilatus TaxID=1464070 RepID=UPI0006E188DD|nr:hypothetical protein [Streptomyces graminilatus]
MGVDIPQPLRTKVEGPIGPITIDGVPHDFNISVDRLPKLAVGIDPLSVGVTELPKISVGLDPIALEPVDVRLSITRVPDVRAHFPTDFTVRVSLLGLQLFAVRLTGEAQMITEPFRPNPAEQTEPPRERPVLRPLPPEDGSP